MNTTVTISRYQAPDDLLKGSVIAVTGAGDGIGRAVAIAYALAGATVILLGRTISKLESVYDEIEQNGGPNPAIYPIDFEGATEEDYINMAIKFDEEFGRLDGLVHNAALLGQRTSIARYHATIWERLFKVNVTAPFVMTKALLPILEKSAQASIIYTSSSVGRQGKAYWGAYGASKAALENLMQTLAGECAETSNIRVNSFDPGATRTSMRAEAYPAEDPKTVKAPEDLLPYYLFLAGSDSIGVNGQQINTKDY